MTYTDTLAQKPNVIDSRDIIERIVELREERDGDPIGFDEWDANELTKLEEFENEQGAEDWEHGEQFIRDDYFETFAEELAEELDYIKADAHWPNNCIDWTKAAEQLKTDYQSVEYEGITYWYR